MIMFSTEDGSGEIFQHNSGGTVPPPHRDDLYLSMASPKPCPCDRVPTGDTLGQCPARPCLTFTSISSCLHAQEEITCVARA